MNVDLFFVGAMPVARPGATGNNDGYCNERRATPQVAPQVERLLQTLVGDMSRDQLQKAIGLQDRKSFRELYLAPALAAGLIEMTIPEKLNSRLQKYRRVGADKGGQEVLK
jgi:hypothetical protein